MIVKIHETNQDWDFVKTDGKVIFTCGSSKDIYKLETKLSEQLKKISSNVLFAYRLTNYSNDDVRIDSFYTMISFHQEPVRIKAEVVHFGKVRKPKISFYTVNEYLQSRTRFEEIPDDLYALGEHFAEEIMNLNEFRLQYLFL